MAKYVFLAAGGVLWLSMGVGGWGLIRRVAPADQLLCSVLGSRSPLRRVDSAAGAERTGLGGRGCSAGMHGAGAPLLLVTRQHPVAQVLVAGPLDLGEEAAPMG